MQAFLKKLKYPRIYKRIFYERLTEPVHLNILALFVALFGGFRRKVEYDLILRCQHAYSLLKAADYAKSLGFKQITVMEFGVAAGTGLMNIAKLSEHVYQETGIKINVFGFDTGKGMPKPLSYKDHPDLYQEGDFPMDIEALKANLPENTQLIIGEISETVPNFINSKLSDTAPIGFISIDVDYYSSTVDCLSILKSKAECYLPRVLVYLDDLEDESHNSYCGELLAIKEFNNEMPSRKIEAHAFLKSYRIFRNARWIDHIFTAHVLDHPVRKEIIKNKNTAVLDNPYLS